MKMKLTSYLLAFAFICIFSLGQINAQQIEFEHEMFDFGMIEEGEKVSYAYKFTNKGTAPLILTNAKGSCGCTVPSWPKEPIAPGETEEIVVTFDTKNKSGRQIKNITITSNSTPAQTVIRIMGEVVPKPLKPASISDSFVKKVEYAVKRNETKKYYESIGVEDARDAVEDAAEAVEMEDIVMEIEDVQEVRPIRSSPTPKATDRPKTKMTFEQETFDFGIINAGEKVRYTFKFTNTGTEDLVLTNAKGSCGCTVPRWPKDPIPPGGTGEIEVTFDSKGKSGQQSKRVTIMANTEEVNTYLKVIGNIIKKEDIAMPLENKEVGEDKDVVIYKVKNEFMTNDCFAIYPNPTSEVLKLETKDFIGKDVVISIYSKDGKLMVNRDLKSIDQEVIEFNVMTYEAGVYIANIRVAGQKPVSKCFVVAR